MRAAIIGLPLVGKTTIFSVLIRRQADAATSGSPKRDPHVGIIRVPDARLDFLCSVFEPRKATYATVEFVDLPGLVRGRGREHVPSQVRNVDALVHVVRAFATESVPHVEGTIDPERDIRDVEQELILSDMATTEKRLERVQKDLKKLKSAELDRENRLLDVIHPWLESGKPLREMNMADDEEKLLRGFAFLSEKPIIYVLNVGEDRIGEARGTSVVEDSRPKTAFTTICGKLEVEIEELEPGERDQFLSSYGLRESGSERLIRTTYRLLGLISFFTFVEGECRAWTIPKGTSAQRAAGTIHTDMDKHFIRAEVVHYPDFQAYGSLEAVRENGLLRLEGKGYTVQDGDLLTVRHGR